MDVLKIYTSLSRFPLGKRLFSWMFCMKAPYFGSVKPYFDEVQTGRCVVKIKKRRAVTNHLRSVHAIAMCNMAEAAAGVCVEATLSKGLRWIPKKMEVEYLKKAMTNLKAVCEIEPSTLVAGEIPVTVNVIDDGEQTVFRAKITMYISARKS